MKRKHWTRDTNKPDRMHCDLCKRKPMTKSVYCVKHYKERLVINKKIFKRLRDAKHG